MRTARRSARRGFTLIELLVVIVVLGILAAISIAKFSETKGRAMRASAITDLKNLATAEESFFADSNRYASSGDISATPAAGKMLFNWSPGQSGGSVTGDATKWSATVTDGRQKHCAIYVNQAPSAPATADGVAACEN
jgi:prepilin-type N-terminal cleavage/methylation domain-containing protein